ncbi:MAG TPA: MlaD family protein [Gemmatimonadaceae bacterium]|nr:MlaD family protein [Gemmatimonadaceae bacterium]
MKHSNDFLIGGVVLAVIVAMIAGILWTERVDIGRRERTVIARFRDVGNIEVGDPAVIRGVRGGQIEAIELAPNGWVNVRMSIDRDVRLPLDPVVLLSEASLFGEWEATITERGSIPHDPAIQHEIADASGERGVLPGSSLPGIAKLTTVAGQIAGDFASVADRVQLAFNDSAARELRASFRNVADLSAILANTVRAHATDLDTLSRELRTTIVSLNRTAAMAERIAQRVDTASSGGQLHQIVDDAAHAATDLRSSSAQINQIADRLTQSQGRLDVLLATGDSVLVKLNGSQGSLGRMLTDPHVYQDSDSLLVELRTLIADIHSNPKKYFSFHVF